MKKLQLLAASAFMLFGAAQTALAGDIVSLVKTLESGRKVTFNIEGTAVKNDAGEVTSAKVIYELKDAELCAEPAGELAPAVEEHKDWEKDGAYMLMIAMDHGDSLKREVNKEKPGCHKISDLRFSMLGPWTFSFNIAKPDTEGEYENIRFDVSAVKPSEL